MGEIHAILPDGQVIKNIDVFKRLYEAVGLGWVYRCAQDWLCDTHAMLASVVCVHVLFLALTAVETTLSPIIYPCRFAEIEPLRRAADAVYGVWCARARPAAQQAAIHVLMAQA